MGIPATIPAGGSTLRIADQRVVMHGIAGPTDQALVALRGEASSPRVAFLDGALEFMTPLKDHERNKSFIGRLLEAYALYWGIDLSPYGSWTLKDAPRQSGVEPDECYIVGADQSRERPDLAIEVVWTSGGSTSSRSTPDSGSVKCGSGRTGASRSTSSEAAGTRA